ncbi:MAG: YfhO family protein [Saccharofermentans sp.]|nr:YfhO family protein [Saccharofermentans sp.]
MGIYPLGSRTILTVDLYHQYMPFIYEFRAKLLEGRTLFYSWNSGLGNEYYAAFANYVASPLNLLCVFFPYKTLPVFVAFLTALRAGLASLFMGMFLTKIESKRYDLVTVCFGCAYALCGWFLTDFWNIMWCDAYMLLPLICVGLLSLIREGKYGLYVISLAICIASNYYAGYMVCIFLVFFAVVSYFVFLPSESISIKTFGISAGRFAFGSIVAGAISAVVVLPTYIILQNSSATGDEFPVDFNPTGNLFDFLGRLMVGANPNIRSGLANVACGVIVALMLPLFFMASKKSGITIRKKIGLGFMLLFLYLSFSMKTLNFIWHGFHYPNQIPYRQSYMMSFILVIIAYMTIRVLKSFSKEQITSVCVGAGFFLILYEKFGTGEEGYIQIGLTLLFLIIQSFVLNYIISSDVSKSSVLELILAITMLFEMLVSTGCTIGLVAAHESFTSYDFYGKNRRLIHEYAMAVEGTSGHQRFERTELYPNNICDIQSVYDVKGMSIFSSTAREGFVKYLRNFGFHNNGINGFRNPGMTRVTATILGVRNQATIENTQNIPLLFPLVADKSEDVRIYENPDALAVGFMTSRDIVSYSPNPAITDVFNKTNDWVRSMGVQADVYSPLNPVSSDESNIVCNGRVGNAITYNMTAGSQATYTLTCYSATMGSDVYAYADSSKGGRVTIKSGDVIVASYELRSYQIIYLGQFDGTPLSATITYNESPAGTLHAYMYELNVSGYEQMVRELSTNQLEVTSYTDSTLVGVVDAGEGGFLFLSIPYSEGFTLTVDGQEAELVPVQDALCGVYLDSGIHEISLSYIPRGFYGSLGISCAGLAILAALQIKAMINSSVKKEHSVNEEKV